jgi:hypothetical protein
MGGASSVPSTPTSGENEPLRPMTSANFTPMQMGNKGGKGIYVKGCWVGNEQIPLFPTIAPNNPFVMMITSRKPHLGEMMEDEVSALVQVNIISQYRFSSYVNVFRRKNGELVQVHTSCLQSNPDTGEEDLSFVEFEMEPIDNEDDTDTYIIFVGNKEPVEGEYKLRLKNFSKTLDTKLVLPRQFNRQWWSSDELMSAPCTFIGNWSGFYSYGGMPETVENCDWLLHCPSYILNVTKLARCTLALTKVPFTDDETWSLGLEKEDRLKDFGMGMVILKLQKGETRVTNSKTIRERILAHTKFPPNPQSEMGKLILSKLLTHLLAEMKSMLNVGQYQLFICTESKRCVS